MFAESKYVTKEYLMNSLTKELLHTFPNIHKPGLKPSSRNSRPNDAFHRTQMNGWAWHTEDEGRGSKTMCGIDFRPNKEKNLKSLVLFF